MDKKCTWAGGEMTLRMTERIVMLPHDGEGIDTEKGDGDPDMRALKSRDSCEDEIERILSDVIHLKYT
jgi:hypothetical protein